MSGLVLRSFGEGGSSSPTATSEKNMSHDVFISHSSADKRAADAACALLEARGIKCWIAPRDIRPGSDWGESIITAIEQARIMLLLLSKQANVSPQIRREVERAVHRSIISKGRENDREGVAREVISTEAG